MSSTPIDSETVLRHLERVLSSAPFRQAERSAGLLRYLVERSLRGDPGRVKEYTIGVEALGRRTDFDPRTDPIVRAEASRLRTRLERYYADEGRSDPVVIDLPKGAYAPRFHLRSTSEESDTTVSSRAGARVPLPRAGLWVLAAGAVIVAYVSGRLTGRPERTGEPAKYLEIQLQSDEALASAVGTNAVLSPDGRSAVLVSLDSLGRTHLRLNRFDGSLAADLPGTSNARNPFWSPDGRWIGFWAAQQLQKIAVDGGAPVVLCDAPDLLGASWGEDGTIIAALDVSSRLFRVDATAGGTPEVILDLGTDSVAPRWPQVLPGGTHVLYSAIAPWDADRGTIEIASLADGRRSLLVPGGTFARFVAPDHITFINQGTLFAVRFDRARLRVIGTQFPILDNVEYSPVFGYAQISIAANGDAMYRRTPSNGPVIVARIDSTGRRTPIVATPGQYGWPALSPDGRHLALSVVEGGVPLLTMYEIIGEQPRLTWSARGYDAPTWTRDGRRLVAHGREGIVLFGRTGGTPHTLYESSAIMIPWSFGPRDERLAFAMMEAPTALDVWTTALEWRGDSVHAAAPAALLRTPAYEAYPAFSPDGEWLAYTSNEAGPPGVRVRSMRDSSLVVTIAAGVRAPRWSRAARQLFLMTADQRVAVVSYDIVDGRFVAGPPRPWSSAVLANTGVLSNYDLSADGSYIVAVVPAVEQAAQAPNNVTLIRGLARELPKRAKDAG